MSQLAWQAGQAAAKSRGRSLFFPLAATILTVLVFVAFSQTFYFRTLTGVEGNVGNGPLPYQAIIHGIVFSVWMLLFLAQSWLVFSNRVRVHRSLGYAGVAVAVGIVVTGAVTTVMFVPRALGFGLATGNIVGIFVGNFVSLILFSIFVGLALWWRKKPPHHKRMMYFATLSILGPALAGNNRPVGAFLQQYLETPGRTVAISIMAALVIYDLVSERRLRWDTCVSAASTLTVRILVTPVIVANAGVQSFILGIS